MILARAALLGLFALPASAQEVSQGTGALLRGLDKVTGDVTDFELRTGTSTTFGRLTVELSECRYPAGNPSGEAYAYLQIRETDAGDMAFTGWMMASSPALNALDHARYDIWVLRCKTS